VYFSLRKKGKNMVTTKLIRLSFSICVLILGMTSRGLAQSNVKDAWMKVFKNCSSSQIVSKKNLVFFGPSNTIGLGSVWKKAPDGGYNARYSIEDLIPNEDARKFVIKLGEQTQRCDSGKSTNWDISAGLPFLGPIFGLTGVDADLRRAKKTTVSAQEVQLDILFTGRLEDKIKEEIKNNPNNSALRDLLLQPDRLLVLKAYRIKGLEVKQEYDPELLKKLKDKLPEGGSVTIGGEKGLKIGFNYSGTSNLLISLPVDVYIAGELSRITKEGSVGLTGEVSTLKVRFTQEPVGNNGVVGRLDNVSQP
jgi:hypothetical protein